MKHVIDIQDLGKIYRIEEDGAIFSLRKNRYLKPFPNTVGYLYASVEMHHQRYVLAVHRIVATKYIGQPPQGKETSHKDGNKLNNHYTNLEYLTHSENVLKSFKEHGRIAAMWMYQERPPFSYETKMKMSNAKKKPVKATFPSGESIIYPSIEDACTELPTYRKAVYRAIYNKTPLNSAKTGLINVIVEFHNPLST
jgi:hypothetical protein